MPEALAPVRVLVCGGRTYGVPPVDAVPADIELAERERAFLVRSLDKLHRKYPVTLLIHGAAAGADTLAGLWARTRGVPVEPCPVTREEWRRYGLRAGPLRNARMLAEHNPERVVAFPGHKGTRDMVTQAEAAGVPVWKPCG
jgi:hypothetical protein